MIGSASTTRRRGLNGRSAALIPRRADSTRDQAASARRLSHQFAGRRHEHVLSRSRHGRPPPSPPRRASWSHSAGEQSKTEPRLRPAHGCRSINREGTVQLQQSGVRGASSGGAARHGWQELAPSSRPSMLVLCLSDVLPVAPPITTRRRAARIQCSPGARVRAAASEQAWSRSRHGRQPFAAQQSK